MRNVFKRNSLKAFLIVSFLLGTMNFAYANPWISVPSGLYLGDTAVIQGGGFTANHGLYLQVYFPDESIQTFNVLTSLEGEITYGVTLSQAGEYYAHVTNGKEILAQVAIMAAERQIGL